MQVEDLTPHWIHYIYYDNQGYEQSPGLHEALLIVKSCNQDAPMSQSEIVSQEYHNHMDHESESIVEYHIHVPLLVMVFCLKLGVLSVHDSAAAQAGVTACITHR